MREKKFAWMPYKVYNAHNIRDGIRWLTYIWLDADGLYYAGEFSLPKKSSKTND